MSYDLNKKVRIKDFEAAIMKIDAKLKAHEESLQELLILCKGLLANANSIFNTIEERTGSNNE